MSRPPAPFTDSPGTPPKRLSSAYFQVAVMSCASHGALLLFDWVHGGQHLGVLFSALLVSVVLAALLAWGRMPLHLLRGALAWSLPVWVLGLVSVAAIQTGQVPAPYFLTLAIVTAVLRATLPARQAARATLALMTAAGGVVLGWAPDQTPLLINAAFLAGLIGFLAEHGVTLHAERQYSEALRVLAVTDALTGTLNRRGGEVAMKALMQEARLGQVAALLLDIDRFKGINDRFGHAAGDEVLSQVARAAGRAAGADVTVIRWGGEEFLLAWSAVQPAQAHEVAARVVRAVRAVRVPGQGQGPAVTVSAGLAFSDEVHGLEALVQLADQRMYAAKQAGGDRWQ